MNSTTSSNTQSFDLTFNDGWVERTCGACGETYHELAVLASIGRPRCPDCRPDPGDLDIDLGSGPSPIGPTPSDRPLMEHGPLSHEGPG